MAKKQLRLKKKIKLMLVNYTDLRINLQAHLSIVDPRTFKSALERDDPRLVAPDTLATIEEFTGVPVSMLTEKVQP